MMNSGATRGERVREVIYYMLERNRYWGIVWIVCAVLITGCKGVSPSRLSDSKGDSAPEVHQQTAGDAELQKIAQAHAHYGAGVIAEVSEQSDTALKEYSQAALKDPENEPLVLEVSRRFVQNKQPEKALELLTHATARPNASGAVYARLGFVYSQLGKTDQAMAASRTAIKKSPGSLAGYQNLFLNYLQIKQPLEAEKILGEAASQPGTQAEFLIGLAELYAHLGLQVPSRRKDANARAVALLNRAEKVSQNNPAASLKLAEDYSIAGDSERAAEIYRELLKKMPEMPGLRERVRARLAEIYLRNSDHKRATEELEGIIADDPTNAQAYYSLGTLALEDKQLEKAAEHFAKTLLLNPDFAPAYYDLARVQIGLKRTSDALATLEKARGKFAQNFLQEYLSGIAFGQQKAYAEAIQHYTAAEVVAQATHPEWLDQHFYFDLGAAYERKGDYTQAEKQFQKCLQLAPDFPEALNYLGYMWAEHGWNLGKARDLIEKALKVEPKNAAYLDSMGWVLFKSDHAQEALEYLLKAVEVSEEPDATLYEHLGDIYAALNQPDKARDAWQKSLSVEENEEVKRKVDKLKQH
jgi:tetratricopeptide (TPR) repeat protein